MACYYEGQSESKHALEQPQMKTQLKQITGITSRSKSLCKLKSLEIKDFVLNRNHSKRVVFFNKIKIWQIPCSATENANPKF